MSNFEPRKNPATHPDEFVEFAYIVDGEVTGLFSFEVTDELHVAMLQSNPIIVKLKPEDKGNIRYGYLYDGHNFTRPV
jgi:hypothetical protein